jgi:hypothetical protein
VGQVSTLIEPKEVHMLSDNYSDREMENLIDMTEAAKKQSRSFPLANLKDDTEDIN